MTPRNGLIALALFALGGCAGLPAPPQLPSWTFIAGAVPADRQPDGNTVVFEDAAGLLVVDTGRHLEHQEKILAHARERGKPIVAIVNTHWHLDHTGGNAELRAAHQGARIYATTAVAGALEGFLARSLERARANLADPKVPEAQKAEIRLNAAAIEDRRNLLPDVPVTGRRILPFGGRGLELRLAERAVSEGDVWLVDPATETVIAGDLVVVPVPFFESACPEGWRRALDDIAAVRFRTLIPGHGEPMTRADFEAWRTGYSNLLACAASPADKKACAEGWARDASRFLTAEPDRKYALAGAEYYVEQFLRDEAKTAELCGATRAA